MTATKWISKIEGIGGVSLNWSKINREAGAKIVPAVLRELRANAPVSATKPDAGRFQKSIGFRVESTLDTQKILFVSTAPYAKWVINPTEGGQLIEPVNTLMLRYTDTDGRYSLEGPGYVFASSIIRGATPGNKFNVDVGKKMRPYIAAAYSKAIISSWTNQGMI
jgi:hypothetical protein